MSGYLKLDNIYMNDSYEKEAIVKKYTCICCVKNTSNIIPIL